MRKNYKPLYSSSSLDDLVAAPLIAIANANGALALRQLKMLFDLCFYYDPDYEKEILSPVEVTLTITRPAFPSKDANPDYLKLETIEATFNVPIITLIPISSLCVDSFEADFTFEFTDVLQQKKGQEAQNKKGLLNRPFSSDGIERFGPRLKGRIAEVSKSPDASQLNAIPAPSKALMDIRIKSGQMDLPDGIKIILTHYNYSQDPVDIKKSK